MKKSLSLLLAFALVFSMFSSLAFAADELSDEQKYEALKAAGIFAGMPDGSAGLDQKMTRAQFARVAGLLAGLDVDAKPTTKTFSDVAETHWAYEEIEAAAAAGLVEGMGDGTFNPSGNVTIQQLAVVAAKILKLDPVEDAKVEGAADWAAPYIQALLNVGIALPTNYKDEALRADLVSVSYEVAVNTGVIAPEKVSVVSAKPVGVSKVEVQLNKAVDTSKATLTLKRNNATVETDVTWSDNKKVATLTLKNTKINEADYTVTLGGLSADQIENATASFKGENETVSRIEFVTTSDEIAKSSKARIKLRPENQYGEIASFHAGSYTVTTDAKWGASLSKDSEGLLVVTLNTAINDPSVIPGQTMIPIYVYYNGNHVTASKTFRLGFEPFITKMEISELKYDNGKDALLKAGDTATAQITLYDQYGNPVSVSQNLNPVFNFNLVPYSAKVTRDVDDFDSDDEYELRVGLNAKEEKSQTFSITVYVGSASGTVSFDVATSKVPNKVELPGYDGTLATGDTGKYVPLIVYDANGEQLTPQEIADNASMINVTVQGVNTDPSNGGFTPYIVTVGPNKGKIALPQVTAPARSYVFVTASIQSPYANSFDTLQIPVNEARKATSLVIDTKPAAKAVLGADSDFKVKVKDQYGDDFGGTQVPNTFRVKYEFEPGSSGITVIGGPNITAAGTNYIYDFDALNDGQKFDTVAGQFGTATLKYTLQEYSTAKGDWIDLTYPVTVSIESIDPTNVELNYALNDIDSLYAALDSGLLEDNQKDPSTSAVAKTVSLTVKDNAGNTVAIPDSIASITTANPTVALYAAANNKGYVLGNKAGETTVTAVVYRAAGGTITLTAKVTVKNDPVEVTSMSANGDKKVAASNIGAGQFVYTSDYMDLKVKDNYGIEYADSNIYNYDKFVGVRYSVSEISGADIAIDATTGRIIRFVDLGGDGKYQFVVTATARNGQSVSTLIFHD